MFCTQCGTQIDLGSKFCKSCGARVDGAKDAPASAEPSATPTGFEAGVRRQQPMPLSPPHDGAGGKKTIVIAASVAVVILAAVGIYFGTDLVHRPAPQETQVAEAPAAKPEEPSLLPAKTENEAAGQPAESPQSSSFEPIAPESASAPPADAPKPLPEVTPKAVPPTDVRPAPRRSRNNPVERPAPASQHGGRTGIYQTIRSTDVFESPAASARVVANIPGGVRVSVVSTSGEWLEVHSRRGNPPGFIRRDDAQFIDSAQ